MDSATLAAYANIFTAVIVILASLYYAYKWREIVWRVAMCLTAVVICTYSIFSYAWILSTMVPSPTPPPLNVVLLWPIFALWHTFFVAILIAMEIREESMIDADCRKRVIELEKTLTNKIQAIADRDFAVRLAKERIEKLEAETKQLQTQNKITGAN